MTSMPAPPGESIRQHGTMPRVEIIPSIGVALVRIGDAQAKVEDRLGFPLRGSVDSKAVYNTSPPLVVSYSPESLVEIVEIGSAGDGRSEAFLEGIQLTFRFLDDVVADLAAMGYTSTPSDIGFDFHAGFAVWSMGSRCARDVDPEADEDDERAVSEGVSIAPYEYFSEGGHLAADLGTGQSSSGAARLARWRPHRGSQ